MNSAKLAATVLAMGLLGQAGLASATEGSAAQGPVMRSEVLADLEVWRASGLAAHRR
jgi:hypothetical protein